MKISPNIQKVAERYPIREDDDFNVTYIDEDSDGVLYTDELRTAEPVLSSEDFYISVAEMKTFAKEKGLKTLTSEHLGKVELESKEREYEGGDDYQYTSLGTLDEYASERPWAIDPLPAKPGELELLIFEAD